MTPTKKMIALISTVQMRNIRIKDCRMKQTLKNNIYITHKSATKRIKLVLLERVTLNLIMSVYCSSITNSINKNTSSFAINVFGSV